MRRVGRRWHGVWNPTLIIWKRDVGPFEKPCAGPKRGFTEPRRIIKDQHRIPDYDLRKFHEHALERPPRDKAVNGFAELCGPCRVG